MTIKLTKHWKRPLLFALKLLLSIALLGYALNYIDIAALKESVVEVRVSHLVFAALVFSCGAFAGSASWYYIIRASGIKMRYLRVAAMYWCGMFFNSFLPSNIGGDFYKGWMLVKDQSIGVSTVASTIIVDRVLNFTIMIVIGLVAFSLALGMPFVAAAIIIFTVFTLALPFFAAYHWKVKEDTGKLVGFLRKLQVPLKAPRHCVAALCAAIFSQGCKIGSHGFIITALGLTIDHACVWYVIPLFGVVSALPISLGGLGIRESVAILISGTMVAAVNTELVTLSLMGHLLFVVVNAFGVIPLLFYRRNNVYSFQP